MTIPLLPYLISIPGLLYQSPHAVSTEIGAMLFWEPLIVGRIVALIGIVIFTLATIQWLWYHHKKVGLFTKGLYSKSRHPQFLGRARALKLNLSVRRRRRCQVGWTKL